MKYFCAELGTSIAKDKFIIEVTSLIEARTILQSITRKVVITNSKGSTKYMGFILIDYIFDVLLEEFPLIEYSLLQTNGDNAAKFSALKSGYIKL